MKASTRNKFIVALIAIGWFSYKNLRIVKENVERGNQYRHHLLLIKKVWGNEKFSEEKWSKATPDSRGKMCYDFLAHHQDHYVGEKIDDLYFPVRLGNIATIDLPEKKLFCYYIGNEKCKESGGKYVYKHALCFYISYRWGPPRRVGGADVKDMSEEAYPSRCSNQKN